MSEIQPVFVHVTSQMDEEVEGDSDKVVITAHLQISLHQTKTSAEHLRKIVGGIVVETTSDAVKDVIGNNKNVTAFLDTEPREYLDRKVSPVTCISIFVEGEMQHEGVQVAEQARDWLDAVLKDSGWDVLV